MASAEDELLRANRAFYDAFAGGDMEGMDALWAQRAPVACIHPGWPPLRGREDVMESWRSILLDGPPKIRCEQAQAQTLGDVGFVTCLEQLETGTLVATNVFVREDALWHMVHHQAGPLTHWTAPEPPAGSAIN